MSGAWGWIELHRNQSANTYILKDWAASGTHLHPKDVSKADGTRLNGDYYVTVDLSDGSQHKEKLTFTNGSTVTHLALGGVKLGGQVVSQNQITQAGVSTPP